MRFLHTADCQLGIKAAHVGKEGGRVREERILTLKRIAEAAQTHSVDFVLIAGDTFEDNGVDRALVQRVADILSNFAVSVYVLPGNHDPLVPGSVWDHPVWRSIGKVTVLREETPIEVPGGFLYPCPVKEKHSDKDPTAWINASEIKEIRIGVAHGTVEGIQQEELDYPIPRDAAVRAGLDYLALGHWHSMATYPAPDGAVRMAYSGTHEATKFGERDSGNVLIVDIPSAGTPPRVTPVRTGNLSWTTIQRAIRESGDLMRIRSQIESMENPTSTLIELHISGLMFAEDRDEINRIQEILNSRFLFNHVDTPMVRPSPEDENWVTNLPHGTLRNTATRLRELADPQFHGERPEGATTEVASRALLELYALVTEVSP